MDKTKTPNTPYREKIGYSRAEFNAIFQIYSQNVYAGFFRDFSFTEHQGRFYISFCEEAGKVPLVTIEKKRLGPRHHLFIATSPGHKGALVEIARSEKLDSFIRQLRRKIEALKTGKGLSATNAENIESIV